ncbi:haloacid dehalogenase-like hydrolase [Nocardiopsis exhalans]|uniref:Haloacid dehalogenase-like hydrolase n=1 Tax=Nocardiopsis exhalans TaxID=163604 RepID=A0ABY5D339_9ACTN|nr:haloacid dehalogenase-like hydrolase [Nocardiopsis exhalans]USY18797.1 haloacid dehalogenase-like hydrolase [Nocardiopsis exhalans]
MEPTTEFEVPAVRPLKEEAHVTWALFDLDETLIDHDSFARFTVHLLLRDPVRLAAAVLFLPLIGAAFTRRSWRVNAGSVLLWLGTVGVSGTRLDRIVRDHVRRLGVRGRLLPDGEAALAEHFRAGHDVAVVTGCAELVAVPLCREIDPRIRVVASTLRRRWGGLVADRHCYGPRKVEMLTEAGVGNGSGGEVVAAYGDSPADAPMLDLARTAVLVNLPEATAEGMRVQLTGPDRVVRVDWPARPRTEQPRA